MNNNHNNGGKFLNGFILGALIGAGVVLLLGTEKGKKILKTIADEGSGLSEFLKDDDFDEEFEEEIPEVKKEGKKKCKDCEEQPSSDQTIIANAEPKNDSADSPISKIAKSSRRFFKGVHKKS